MSPPQDHQGGDAVFPRVPLSELLAPASRCVLWDPWWEGWERVLLFLCSLCQISQVTLAPSLKIGSHSNKQQAEGQK